MKLQKRKTKATTKPNNLVKKLVTKDSVSSLMSDVRDSRLWTQLQFFTPNSCSLSRINFFSSMVPASYSYQGDQAVS